MGEYLKLADEMLRKAAASISADARNKYLRQAADYESLAYRKGETRTPQESEAGKAQIEAGEKGYTQARTELTEGFGKAKDVLTDKMAQALKALSDRYTEIDNLIKEESKGAAYDPSRRVTLAATPIRQGIDTLARTLMDFSQRTGSTSGKGTKKVVEQALSQLVPLASQETRAAFEGQAGLARERREWKGKFAEGEKGINVDTGVRLANYETNLATDLSGLEKERGATYLRSGLTERAAGNEALRERMFTPLEIPAAATTGGGASSNRGELIDQLLKLREFQASIGQRAVAGGSSATQFSMPVPIRPGSARAVLYDETMNKMRNILNAL